MAYDWSNDFYTYADKPLIRLGSSLVGALWCPPGLITLVINVYAFLVVIFLPIYAVPHCLYSAGNKITNNNYNNAES